MNGYISRLLEKNKKSSSALRPLILASETPWQFASHARREPHELPFDLEESPDAEGLVDAPQLNRQLNGRVMAGQSVVLQDRAFNPHRESSPQSPRPLISDIDTGTSATDMHSSSKRGQRPKTDDVANRDALPPTHNLSPARVQSESALQQTTVLESNVSPEVRAERETISPDRPSTLATGAVQNADRFQKIAAAEDVATRLPFTHRNIVSVPHSAAEYRRSTLPQKSANEEVHIHIGRVEVRGATAANPQPAAAKPSLRLSLQQISERRDRGRRR
jgi:hypothetical protein